MTAHRAWRPPSFVSAVLAGAAAAAALAVPACASDTATSAAGTPVESTQAGSATSPAASAPAMYTYRVVNTYPHDPAAFTQGLVFRDGELFESTGLKGESTLRRVRLETGEVLQRKALEPRYFAEGLTAWNGRLIQLTWQAQVGFVYDIETFDLIRTFDYTGEGWGLAHDGARLLMSDGSPVLRWIDPETFAEMGRLPVSDRGTPVDDLNELELVRGEIYANVWQSDRIARISPETGDVLGWIDLAGILSLSERTHPDAVLNGIAYDEAGDRLFVTGKLWPKLFEIRVERRRAP